MNILLLQDYLRIGGTEKQTLFLARTFKEQGEDVSLLLFRPGGHLAGAPEREGISTAVLQPFDSRVCLWAPGLKARLRSLSPDLILCMGRTANCYAGFIQQWLPQTAVVGTLRTGKMLFPLHHWSMGHVRAVLVNSNWWKRRLLERRFPPERIHVVHNALLLERAEGDLKDRRREIRDTYAVAEDCCVFLNVATFRPGKRHLDLLKTFAALRTSDPDLDWRLWLVGDGREYNRCRRWAAEHGLGTRVRFFHFQKDPLPFYAGADVAVSASREDSLPNFLIEAQASGLPVVAYDCRGVNETCIPAQTGLILEQGDHDGFVEALRRLARDPATRKQLADGAPAFAAQRFARGAQAMETLRFLRGLVHG
jgi:glycosyltransferase involved in cell wall biosynthesis